MLLFRSAFRFLFTPRYVLSCAASCSIYRDYTAHIIDYISLRLLIIGMRDILPKAGFVGSSVSSISYAFLRHSAMAVGTETLGWLLTAYDNLPLFED